MTQQTLAIREEFTGAPLGDRRRGRRLECLAEQLSHHPERSIPASMVDGASLEGAYRFLDNEQVSPEAILAPHIAKTRERAGSCKRVIVAHDTTTFCFPGEVIRQGLGRLTGEEQGFFSHISLALAQEDRRPLGVVAFKHWTRPRGKSKPRKPQPKSGLPGTENGRWFEAAKQAQEALGASQLVHVMDREADGYTLMNQMASEHMNYVIRACHPRRAKAPATGDWSTLGKLVNEQGVFHLKRDVQLSKRPKNKDPKRNKKHPPRPLREAHLVCHACSVELKRPGLCSKNLADSITVQVIEVTEPDPPEGHAPIHWRLLTNLPVETSDQVSQIIDDYRARWVIEEFFKALKTGCAFEKLQLESYGNLKRALSVYMPIAWQLLLLRTLAQRDDDVPAHHAMASKRLNLLRKLLLSLARYTLPEHPSASDVFFGVAKLGGHIKWNGPPGWITIGRGWNRLLEAEITASTLEDVIND